MTTSPSEPVSNAQVSDADELPSGGKDDILSDGIDHEDESDTDTAVPDPPD